jgi:hypothetical protein
LKPVRVILLGKVPQISTDAFDLDYHPCLLLDERLTVQLIVRPFSNAGPAALAQPSGSAG